MKGLCRWNNNAYVTPRELIAPQQAEHLNKVHTVCANYVMTHFGCLKNFARKLTKLKKNCKPPKILRTYFDTRSIRMTVPSKKTQIIHKPDLVWKHSSSQAQQDFKNISNFILISIMRRAQDSDANPLLCCEITSSRCFRKKGAPKRRIHYFD